MHTNNDARTRPTLNYQTGFGNNFESEAIAGALPKGQNSPQRPPFGLHSELISGTGFTAPRAQNKRSYFFRIFPSVAQGSFEALDFPNFQTPPLENAPYPGALRWGPFKALSGQTDFLEGINTICANGSPRSQTGMAIHVYRANRSMGNRAFSNRDGELLILPQDGEIRVVTEMGIIDAEPGEFVLIPKAIRFRVDLLGNSARGFICENYGHPFILPDLGLIGSHGLANAVDFQIPVAAFEDNDTPSEIIHKFAGGFWSTTLNHSPFDVVAWRGNLVPCKYDMNRFVAMGTLTVDHPDPSIFCALTSPSSSVEGGNVDFMILPPRWAVSEHSFRPPGFHRNVVTEFLGLIKGSHESRASKFPPGSCSLHNNWTAHGPDVATFEAARKQELKPVKIEDAIVFMFETRYPVELSSFAMEAEERQRDCEKAWEGFQKRFPHDEIE